MIVCAFGQSGVASAASFGDMSRKCSPIVNINGVPYRQRARERERGEEEEGIWEGERNGFSPVLYHKERERKKKDDRGEKCLRGSAWGRRIVLVVVGPRSECGCEVTHWIIQWMLGEDYFSTNPPAERAGPPTSDAAETPLPLAFQFPPFYYVGRNQRRFRSPCHRTTF